MKNKATTIIWSIYVEFRSPHTITWLDDAAFM